MRLWDVRSGRCARVLTGHAGYVRAVAMGGDGRHALSASGDRTVRLWDVERGRCLRLLEGHGAGVYDAAFSADGRRAMSGSRDGTVRLWELTTGRVSGDVFGARVSRAVCGVGAGRAERAVGVARRHGAAVGREGWPVPEGDGGSLRGGRERGVELRQSPRALV
jgi:hypothetical protein